MDITTQRSKHVDEVKDVGLDYVVTVCGNANESCPVFPGRAKVIHVGFDDPPKLAKTATDEEERWGITGGCGMRSGRSWRRCRGRLRSRRGEAGSDGREAQKYAAEMIGTFALVFAGTGAVVVNDRDGGGVTQVGVAITFGLVVMAMIYALGDVSGRI